MTLLTYTFIEQLLTCPCLSGLAFLSDLAVVVWLESVELTLLYLLLLGVLKPFDQAL